MDEHMMAAEIAALKNEIETLKGMVKAERENVLQEVIEAFKIACDVPTAQMAVGGFSMWLDSMEDKTNV